MGATPNRGYPRPEYGDDPDLPGDLQALAEAIDTDVHKWTGQLVTYTPTWTATGGTPVLGDGSLIGKYRRWGSLCQVRITLTIGGTTNFGTTSAWTFGLPIASAGPTLMPASVIDTGTGVYPCCTNGVGASSVRVHVPTNTNSVGYNNPMTWQALDVLSIYGIYEVAAE